jgi:hypothetical protein
MKTLFRRLIVLISISVLLLVGILLIGNAIRNGISSSISTSSLSVPHISFIDSGQKLGSVNNWDVQLVDINEDKILEAYFEGFIWKNDGQGHFTKGDISFGPIDKQAWFADLNGDGHVDAICNNTLFLNDGKGVFSLKKAIPSDIDMSNAVLADLNGDKAIDLISADAYEDRILLNDGSGNFTNTGKKLGGWSQCGYAVGDINGDGIVDVYVSIPHTPPPDMVHTPNLIWIGEGQGNFTKEEDKHFLLDSRDAVMADFNKDGKLDVFVASGESAGSKLFLNDGKGKFTDSGQSINSEFHAADVQMADLDNDGDIDLFVGNGLPLDNGQPNTIWINNGKGQFNDSGLRLGNLNSVKVALGDLNGDGKIDAIVANVANQINTSSVASPVEVWINATQKSK